MINKYLFSLIAIALLVNLASPASAFIVQNKTDRSFFVQSPNIEKICNGAEVKPDKKKYTVFHCNCSNVALFGCGCCAQQMTLGPRDKIVLKGKKGDYKLTIYPEEGKKQKMRIGCAY